MKKPIENCIMKTSLKILEDTIEAWTEEQFKALAPYELYEKDGKEVSREINNCVVSALLVGLFGKIEREAGFDDAIIWINRIFGRCYEILKKDYKDIDGLVVFKKRKKNVKPRKRKS